MQALKLQASFRISYTRTAEKLKKKKKLKPQNAQNPPPRLGDR